MAMQGSSRFAVESGDVSSKFDDDGQRNELVYMYIYIYIYISLFYSFNTYNSQYFS